MIDLITESAVTARLQSPIGCNRSAVPALAWAAKHQLNIGVRP